MSKAQIPKPKPIRLSPEFRQNAKTLQVLDAHRTLVHTVLDVEPGQQNSPRVYKGLLYLLSFALKYGTVRRSNNGNVIIDHAPFSWVISSDGKHLRGLSAISKPLNVKTLKISTSVLRKWEGFTGKGESESLAQIRSELSRFEGTTGESVNKEGIPYIEYKRDWCTFYVSKTNKNLHALFVDESLFVKDYPNVSLRPDAVHITWHALHQRVERSPDTTLEQAEVSLRSLLEKAVDLPVPEVTVSSEGNPGRQYAIDGEVLVLSPALSTLYTTWSNVWWNPDETVFPITLSKTVITAKARAQFATDLGWGSSRSGDTLSSLLLNLRGRTDGEMIEKDGVKMRHYTSYGVDLYLASNQGAVLDAHAEVDPGSLAIEDLFISETALYQMQESGGGEAAMELIQMAKDEWQKSQEEGSTYFSETLNLTLVASPQRQYISGAYLGSTPPAAPAFDPKAVIFTEGVRERMAVFLQVDLRDVDCAMRSWLSKNSPETSELVEQKAPSGEVKEEYVHTYANALLYADPLNRVIFGITYPDFPAWEVTNQGLNLSEKAEKYGQIYAKEGSASAFILGMLPDPSGALLPQSASGKLGMLGYHFLAIQGADTYRIVVSVDQSTVRSIEKIDVVPLSLNKYKVRDRALKQFTTLTGETTSDIRQELTRATRRTDNVDAEAFVRYAPARARFTRAWIIADSIFLESTLENKMVLSFVEFAKTPLRAESLRLPGKIHEDLHQQMKRRRTGRAWKNIRKEFTFLNGECSKLQLPKDGPPERVYALNSARYGEVVITLDGHNRRVKSIQLNDATWWQRLRRRFW